VKTAAGQCNASHRKAFFCCWQSVKGSVGVSRMAKGSRSGFGERDILLGYIVRIWSIMQLFALGSIFRKEIPMPGRQTALSCALPLLLLAVFLLAGCASTGPAVIPFSSGCKGCGRNSLRYGLFDAKGRIVLSPAYGWIGDFSPGNGLALARRSGNYGFLDRQGRVAIPFIYQEANAAGFGGEAYARVRRADGQWGDVDAQGHFFPEGSLPASRPPAPAPSGCPPLEIRQEIVAAAGAQGIRDAAKYGLYGINGKMLFPPIFDSLYSLPPGHGKHGERKISGTGGCLLAYKKGNKFGLIDGTGRLLSLPEYDSIEAADWEGNVVAIKKNGKLGLLGRRGQIAIPPRFDRLDSYGPGGLAKFTEKGKAGIVDDTPSIVVPARYEDLSIPAPFRGKVEAYANNKWGVIDLRGNVLIPLQYDSLSGPLPDGLYYASRGKQHGVVDAHGFILRDTEICGMHVWANAQGSILWPPNARQAGIGPLLPESIGRELQAFHLFGRIKPPCQQKQHPSPQ
jgi:hypothetical protein